MELTAEFIEKNNLSAEQVTAIQTATGDNEAELKKGWDGKANENAERILSGASEYVKTKMGSSVEREQGEKVGDYIKRISDSHFISHEKSLSDSKAEYDLKIQNFKGDDELKTKNEELSTANDGLLQKLAVLEPLKGLDVKNAELTKSFDALNLSVALGKVKPRFADTVNEYEAKAKWESFVSDILKDYDIKIVDNEAMAISKENIHSQKKLSELVEGNEVLKALKKGRQQTGPSGEPKDFMDLTEIPFKIPEKASTEEKSKLIREYLAEKGIDNTSPEYAKEFKIMNLKIAEEIKKANV